MTLEKTKKYFFGWSNIKSIITEFSKIYSTKPSLLSKKRIESGIAFIVAQWGMIFFLLTKISIMTTSDLAIWASIEFAISGYIINHIQKEKSVPSDNTGEAQ